MSRLAPKEASPGRPAPLPQAGVNFAVIALIPLLIGAIVWSWGPPDSDSAFWSIWTGLRQFLAYQASPYGDLGSSSTLDLSMPFPTLLLFLPLALVGDIVVAHAIWAASCALSVMAAAALAWLSHDDAVARSKFYTVGVTLILVLTAAPLLPEAGESFLLVLVCGLLIWTYRTQQDVLTGILLSVLFVKWQLGLGVLLLMLGRALASRRAIMVTAFFFTMAIEALLAFILYPEWLRAWLAVLLQVGDAAGSSPGVTWVRMLAGNIGGAIPWLLLGACAIAFAMLARAEQDSSTAVSPWKIATTICIAYFLPLPVALGDLIALLPGQLLLLDVASQVGSAPRRWTALFFLGVSVGLPLVARYIPKYALFPSLLEPRLVVPAVVLLGLLWVRSWLRSWSTIWGAHTNRL